MPDELDALRAENLSLQKNISRQELELEKRSSALEKKTLQCDKKETPYEPSSKSFIRRKG